MGVKVTVRLTREECINRILELRLQQVRKIIELALSLQSDTALENELETDNDAYYREKYGVQSGFTNYLIVDKSQLGKTQLEK